MFRVLCISDRLRRVGPWGREEKEQHINGPFLFIKSFNVLPQSVSRPPLIIFNNRETSISRGIARRSPEVGRRAEQNNYEFRKIFTLLRVLKHVSIMLCPLLALYHGLYIVLKQKTQFVDSNSLLMIAVMISSDDFLISDNLACLSKTALFRRYFHRDFT